jgi:hypothetical protein
MYGITPTNGRTLPLTEANILDRLSTGTRVVHAQYPGTPGTVVGLEFGDGGFAARVEWDGPEEDLRTLPTILHSRHLALYDAGFQRGSRVKSTTTGHIGAVVEHQPWAGEDSLTIKWDGDDSQGCGIPPWLLIEADADFVSIRERGMQIRCAWGFVDRINTRRLRKLQRLAKAKGFKIVENRPGHTLNDNAYTLVKADATLDEIETALGQAS